MNTQKIEKYFLDNMHQITIAAIAILLLGWIFLVYTTIY